MRRRDCLRGALAAGSAWLMGAAKAEPGSRLEAHTLPSRLLGEPIRFQLYLPPSHDPATQRLPVLMLLHGRGDNFQAWTRVRPLLDELIASGQLPPLIAVMPDAPTLRRGGYYVDSAHARGQPLESALLTELLPAVCERWQGRTDRDGRLVAGYSMGGYGALRYALAHPALFAGAIVLSPAAYVPLPPPGSSAREFGAFGRGQELFVDEVYQALNYPALLRARAEQAMRSGQPAPPQRFYIAAGDGEYAHPDPAWTMNDIDMEAHRLFKAFRREPGLTAQLRILGGGHDWDVWMPAFREGLLSLWGSAART